MSVEAFDPGSTTITLSEQAASKVKDFMLEEGNPNLLLRVFVTGGGCSGFQYGFTFADNPEEDDSVYEQYGVRLVVDSMSYQYLIGALIVYEESVAGSRFSIKNPNASTTCGCGSSFSI